MTGNTAQLMNEDEFQTFFQQYSQNVDNAESIGFWKLSDAIVERICLQLAAHHGAVKTVFDAGGGTGRWIERLSSSLDADFILFDRSVDMLGKARQRFERSGLSKRVSLIQGDLETLHEAPAESADLVISTYGVISFLSDPQAGLATIARILRPGGIVMVMGHGFHNSLYSKIMNSRISSEELARMVETSQVKWAPHVPWLRTYSQESLRALLEGAGLSFLTSFGVPLFMQPGPEDFDPENKLVSNISQSLLDPGFFNSALELEMQFNSQPEVVNRGVNIIGVARKA
jgi:ubiquinone/menaquinone biosynthesis C-methylase UbiE